MGNGMTSDFTLLIIYLFMKTLIIIDKFIPLAVTLNNQFITLLYIHISAAKYELFMQCICHLE